MSILSLSNESFNEILTFLDNQSLYNCLFVNRYYCKLSIPILWRNPFKHLNEQHTSIVINTLLSCLDEDEISSLIPCAIIFPNNKLPLFDYGKFVRKIYHKYVIENIVDWLHSSKSSNGKVDDQDCKVQKLVHVIYYMIMRQGSNLQDFFLSFKKGDLAKFSIFTTYKPGITNLSSFHVIITLEDTMKYQNAFEFLNMVSTFCNGIVEFNLYFLRNFLNDDDTFIKPFLDIIKLQPLENLLIYTEKFIWKENFKKIIYFLEFRSETLRELEFSGLNFQGIDLSFISKLECLESLIFVYCKGFTFQHCDGFSKKFDLKKLKLLYSKYDDDSHIMEKIISSLVGKSLCKLTLSIFTLEIFKAVKESCPSISFLHVDMDLKDLIYVIPYICDLTSLKTLHLEGSPLDDTNGSLVANILGDYLTSVEHLYLNFYINLSSFEYFTDKCKANLKKWLIMNLKAGYLSCVIDYKKANDSLKILGTNNPNYVWSDLELWYIEQLNNYGVNVMVNQYDFEEIFYDTK